MNVVSELTHRHRVVDRAADEQRWDLPVLIDVVRRRGRAIVVSLAICLGLAVAYLVVTPDVYTATSVLMTDTRQTPPSPSQVTSELLIDPAVIESQIEILKSQQVALDVVDRLHLDNDPEFVGSGPDWKARLLAALFHNPIVAPSEENRRTAAVNALTHKLKVLRTGHSYLADIAVTTLDPAKSAAIANAVADAYIQDQLDGRAQANQRAAAWMKQRVDQVRAEAEASTAALEAFRRQNAGVLATFTASDQARGEHGLPPGEKALPVPALDEGRLDALTAAAPSGSVLPLTPAKLDALAAIDDPSLQQLVGSVRKAGLPAAGQAPSGPQADAAASVQARVAQLLTESRNNLKAAADAVAVAARQDTATQGAAEAGERATERLKALSTAAESAHGNFEALQNRYARLTQFMQQQSLPTTEARLVTTADPPLGKSAPKSSVTLLLAAIGGALLGVGLVFLRESLDRRIRWPHQVRRALGLPLAGSLPLVRHALAAAALGEMSVSRLQARLLGQPSSGLVTLFDSSLPRCAATQTLRSVKLAIDQGVHRNAGAIVGVVSAWPGEGKSTLAHNLARMLVEMDARVLVIDADLGKPDLSATFAPGGGRGILDLVEGVAIEHCIAATPFGFDLLPSGGASAPRHPFHVLASQHMQHAFAAAKHAYDYVIVDLPALMVSIDSQAIAGALDTFVLVTDYGRTTTEDVERSLATSDVIASRIVATVLNRSRVADRDGRRGLRAHLPSIVGAPA